MRLLLIEDDKAFSDSLTFQLKQEDIMTDVCADGRDALDYIEQNVYDLILLDRMLPHLDGISLLKQLRREQNPTPVIILTALGEVKDRITGLDAGADDYLVKPFDFEELMARIRSVGRRQGTYLTETGLSFSDLSYSPDTHLLKGTSQNCTLSRTEGALLELFLHNPNQILPRDTILSRIWGPYGDVEDGNLDNYIYFIRRRLRSVSNCVCIKTIRGVGYRLEEQDSLQ